MKHPGAYHIRIAPIGDEQNAGSMDDLIHKGIVEEVGTAILLEPDDHERLGEMLTAGNTVYYRGGFKIGDSIFIESTDIISYERSPEHE
jgi:hypothetical protein